ncbi:hypothetical protein [Aquincola tertiaricarbonis]|uniref:hypothetical protein n=1 Tax=Aquincola tertiaricarbonis TaxID=391953 RepID=UPI000614C572|nr:hypothetical protein [Aquincola tertiaricarbonis]
MIGPWLRRQQRRALLRRAGAVGVEQALRLSLQRAQGIAERARQRSPAYRRLLLEHGISLVAPLPPLGALPVLDKDCSFARHPLEELAGGLRTQDIGQALTSSGRGGGVFGFKLSTRGEMRSARAAVDLGLQQMFRADERSTLVVNCLPMGVTFDAESATVANVSVREDMACALMQQLGPSYQQVVVCTDPLFVRRLLAHAEQIGLDWPRLHASMVLGEEMLVEPQRRFIADALGITPGDGRLVVSSMGIGELGLHLFFEDAACIAVRQALQAGARWPGLQDLEDADGLPSLFCFDAQRCHVETVGTDARGDGELVVTLLDPRTPLLLPRYATGDLARLVPPACAAAACQSLGLPPPVLPWLLVHGRRRDRAAGRPSVERIKECLYADAAVARRLTGAFRLQADGRLLVQAADACSDAELATLAGSLSRQLAGLRQGSAPLQLVLRRPHDCGFGPPLDHERKFAYVE